MAGEYWKYVWCENRGEGFSAVRQLELFIEWSSKKLPWDKSLDRNQCRLRTVLLTDLYILKELLNIMGPLGSAMSRNCWQGEEASYHVLCQCPAANKITIEICVAASSKSGNVKLSSTLK